MQKLRFRRYIAPREGCLCVKSPNCQPRPNSLKLSFDCVFVYILRQSDVLGRLTSGSVQWDGATLAVHDTYEYPLEYFSGDRLKSWAVFRSGALLGQYSRFDPEDLNRLQTRSFS